MKKLTLSFVLISIAFYSFGQDPNILLDLNPPSNGISLRMNFPGYTGSWARGFSISNENTVPHFGIGALGHASNGITTFDRGWIGKDYNNAYMNFLPNGNIGVGTEYPENIENWSRVFEVHGNEHAKSLVSSNQVISGLWAHDYGFYGAPSGGIVGTYSNHPFSIITNSSSKITIMPDGNVGLGTITPRSMLDINKPLNGGKLGAVLGRLAEGDGTGEGTFLGVRGYNTSYNTPEPFSSKSFALEHSFYGKINSSINFYRGDDVIGGEISFNTNSNIERMRIDGLGNVGIGTSIPKEKLAVNGNVSVNGKIGAKEVKVEAKDWPDYVFAKDYVLPSLAETEKQIKEKGQLPGIPSATDVKTNGIELGEMNAKLLKKIEELTPYIIDLEKRVKTIETKNNKLSKLK